MSEIAPDFRRSFNITRQLEHYLAEPSAANDRLPLSVEQLESAARARMSPEHYEWVAGAAGNGDAAAENVRAFDRWKIVPRMLQDVATPDCGVQLGTTYLPCGCMVAPIGVQQASHIDGEKATARGAAEAGWPMIVSTVSTFPMEEVAAAAPDGQYWFQLYWSSEPDLNRSLLDRAKAAGYQAIVVTLDTQRLGWREGNLQQGFLPFLRRVGLANYISDPVFRSRLPRAPEDCRDEEVAAVYFDVFSDLAHTWEDLRELREATDLPLWIKGIQHPDDVAKALDQGVHGLIVSNHGGRQVSGGIATLDVLAEVVEAVDGRVPVLIDSGIRRGSDVFKAKALGANAVLIGRPFMWALAVGGARGVADYLQNFAADVELNMTLAGRNRLNDIERNDVRQIG